MTLTCHSFLLFLLFLFRILTQNEDKLRIFPGNDQLKLDKASRDAAQSLVVTCGEVHVAKMTLEKGNKSLPIGRARFAAWEVEKVRSVLENVESRKCSRLCGSARACLRRALTVQVLCNILRVHGIYSLFRFQFSLFV